MKALLFRYSLPRFALATVVGKLTPRAYLRWGGVSLADVTDPILPADDWVIVRTSLCGICGSDVKQVFLDGGFDNPIRSLISFPAVLGHEAVGTVERVGNSVSRVKAGERVVLNPWLSCGPRGVEPCSACRDGQYPLCDSFTRGCISPALHLGNCRDVNGAFAPLLAAHESQLFAIPENVNLEQAVLADPFSVSLHGVLKVPPTEGALALVYGCGTLGLLTIAILRELYPSVRVVVISKYPYQADLARKMGAEVVCTRDPNVVIETVAKMVGTEIHRPNGGKPWLLRGADVVYDTVGSPETLEVGLRVAAPRASIVVTGVAKPARFEWTPLYFKEIAVVGSNAFGVETFNDSRLHAMEIYLQLVSQGRIDLSWMVTHRFRLDQYEEAFLTVHRKARNRAVKAVFQF